MTITILLEEEDNKYIVRVREGKRVIDTGIMPKYDYKTLKWYIEEKTKQFCNGTPPVLKGELEVILYETNTTNT